MKRVYRICSQEHPIYICCTLIAKRCYCVARTGSPTASAADRYNISGRRLGRPAEDAEGFCPPSLLHAKNIRGGLWWCAPCSLPRQRRAAYTRAWSKRTAPASKTRRLTTGSELLHSARDLSHATVGHEPDNKSESLRADGD